ncbi:MAG: hypothetical protein HYW02_03730 [Deltaproteobacteria bacterium]|nr:hypothetical protein [Deltaproteobacteria bacterium]MBI2500576.1 hypothetical protein [Deltaproteobacteria bacterium]
MIADSIFSPGSFGFVEDRDRSSNAAVIGSFVIIAWGGETLKRAFILGGSVQLGASLIQKALFSPYPPLERTADIGIESTVGVIGGGFSAILFKGIDYLLVKPVLDEKDTFTISQSIGLSVVTYAALIGGMILSGWIHSVINKPTSEIALGHPKEVVSLS